LTYYALQDQKSISTELDYSSVSYSAGAVGAGLRSYYYQNCSDGAGMVSPTVPELIAGNFIQNPDAINNRLELVFTTLIEAPGTSQSKLVVSTTAPSAAIASQIADQIDGAISIDSTVSFYYKPTVAVSARNIRFQQMQEYFGDTTCN